MTRAGVADAREDSWASAAFLAAAATALGRAIQVSNGNRSPDALLWLTVACLTSLIAVALPRLGFAERWMRGVTVLFVGAAVIVQFVQLFTSSPGMYLVLGPRTSLTFGFELGIAAFVAGNMLAEKPWLGRAALPLAIAAHFALGVWLIQTSPNPSIDVFVFHRLGQDAFFHGHSPYSTLMPNIYGVSAFYGPGIVDGNHLTIGFPYPPLSLLVSALGTILGDYRYAHLAAMSGAAAFMACSGSGWLGRAAATLFLFTPRFLFVLEQGWTEPLIVLFLAAVVFCARRRPAWVPWALGLLFAVKQHLVLLAPLTVLLMPTGWTWRGWLKMLGKAVALTAVVTLPFALWDFAGFWTSVVMFQIRQPFRTEALSYLSWMASEGMKPPLWLGFAALVPAVALGLWRGPRSPAGFAAAAAVLYVAFFAFSKQAFCNYYYFVVGALCVALAAMKPREYL